MSDYPIIETLNQWRPIFTQAAVWRPMIEEIWRRHRLGAVEQVEPGFAGSNAVFVVNEDWVVKIFAPFWAGDASKELEIYYILADYPDLLTPHVIAHGTIATTQEWPYIVMTRLPGLRLGEVWPHVPLANRLAIMHHLAEMVQTLHAVPTGRVTTMDIQQEAWVAFVERQMAGAAAHHQRNSSLPKHLLAQLPGYLADALPLFPSDFRPTIINCDLTCDHVLLTEQDGHWHITGLIDFGDVQVGHVDYEWVALHLSLLDADRDLLRAFLCTYGWEQVVDERFSRRMMAYSLLHLFSDMRPFVGRLGGPERVQRIEELETALWRL